MIGAEQFHVQYVAQPPLRICIDLADFFPQKVEIGPLSPAQIELNLPVVSRSGMANIWNGAPEPEEFFILIGDEELARQAKENESQILP